MMDNKYFIIFQVFFTFGTLTSSEYIPLSTACDSQIYCNGTLLHYVQMLKVFHDSKTFVDMQMKFSFNDTMKNFDQKMKDWKYTPTKYLLEEFVNEFFDKEDSELEEWTPTDWIKNKEIVNNIKDEKLKDWAKYINNMWPNLGRKIRDDVRLRPEYYSIIYVPNPFIIPGGRFREIYYWDSYWIIRGLIICDMHITAKGIISNYISMVQTFGHVPNGGRIYYSKRSQPPMLIPMVKSYLDATNDMKFVIENINALEIEFNYWITQHNVTIGKNGKKYTLAVYKDLSTGPRPESYREDINQSTPFSTVNEKENFYSELKAAAESGWDFSSRWYIVNGTNEGKQIQVRDIESFKATQPFLISDLQIAGGLLNTKTRSIIPVELNALLYWNAKILSDFYREMNNSVKALIYESISLEWEEAVTAVLWDEEVGAWLDFDIINNIRRNYFYPTNISPLWTGCYAKNNTDYLVTRVLNYLNKSEILNTAGGIPTTLRETDQQWDQPNAWPPLQYIVVMGLENTGHKGAKQMASKIAYKWLCTNYVPYYNYTKMYEKYRVNAGGEIGKSTGEYPIQDGFGWTNGIILEFLQLYNSTASSDDWNVTAPLCYEVLQKLIIVKESKNTNKIDNN
ncbi:trehalase-like [Acyrthosiphon pisum]|uniref:Trehalase n=1 Tax=Acyrthosiphon pisum TaxID=7029 RepID=A0A8R2NM22_ACYPI|nr:trehalase-like [Acyrthosiphon pisum]